MDWPLNAAAIQAIDRILERTITGPVSPDFMASPPASARRPVA
jgi:hypothetical protein